MFSLFLNQTTFPQGLRDAIRAAAGLLTLACASQASQAWAHHPGQPLAPAELKLVAGSPGGSGIADGPCASARFTYPLGVVLDQAHNMYVADFYANTIRKITPDCTVSTLAGKAGVVGSSDGVGAAAAFNGPTGLVIDTAGNLYLTDTRNNVIRKVTPSGVVSTIAGQVGVTGHADGQGKQATFDFPQGLAIAPDGTLYVADTYNDTVRRISTAGVVETVAGVPNVTGAADGTGSKALFNEPTGIVVLPSGNILLADSHNYTLRQVTPAGVVTTFAGTTGVPGKADGAGAQAQFAYPTGLAVDAAGNIYIVDSNNNAVRKATPSGAVTTFAGKPGESGSANGPALSATFNYPTGIVVSHDGTVYVADSRNFAIRAIDPGLNVQTLAGDATSGGSTDGPAEAARLQSPNGVAVDWLGNKYVADTANNTIRKISAKGYVSTLAGLAHAAGSTDGKGGDARFSSPAGVAVGLFGEVYVADTFNNVIRAITPNGVVRTIAGKAGVAGSKDGIGSEARFNHPVGIAVGRHAELFVTDGYNNTIRRINWKGEVSTVAGVPGVGGSADGPAAKATFSYPMAVVQTRDGSLYVADAFNNTVRKIDSKGVVSTLAGVAGTHGYADGKGSEARFVYPCAITADLQGNVYVADMDNQLIRRITPQGVVTTYIGRPNDAGNVLGPLPGGLSYPAGIAANHRKLFIATGNAIVSAPLPSLIGSPSGGSGQ